MAQDTYTYTVKNPVFAELENRIEPPWNGALQGKWACVGSDGVRYVGEYVTTTESTRGVKLTIKFGNKAERSVLKARCTRADNEATSAVGPPPGVTL